MIAGPPVPSMQLPLTSMFIPSAMEMPQPLPSIALSRMMMEFAELVTKIPPAGHSLCEIVDSTMRLIQPYAIRIATFSALSA